jgi:hypothetical protein
MARLSMETKNSSKLQHMALDTVARDRRMVSNGSSH